MKQRLYPTKSNPDINDRILIVDSQENDKTKNVPIKKIIGLIQTNLIDGKDGVGVASTVSNSDGTFTITYTDGSTFISEDLTGPIGPAGPAGESEDKTTGNVTGGADVANSALLSYDLNICNSGGQYFKLPVGSIPILKEVHVLTASSGGITVVGSTSGVSRIYSSGVGTVQVGYKIPQNKVVKFIHLGSNFWLAQNEGLEAKRYKVVLTNNGGGSFGYLELINDFYGVTFSFTNPSNGIIRVTSSNSATFTANKSFLTPTIHYDGTAYFVTGETLSSSFFDVKLVKYDNTMTGTPSFTNLVLEFWVYP